ncbi:MAG: rhomboid family intramembrane serine protease [Wenyingzhuangia sp.]|jgi:membrane associated rhomboid family serine protease|uniref:rhomboid family intramembrane serine protease n=1 Tax=Wenyingzhuangia sp. TaxID=1964193 RepID=UPI00321B8821
MNRVPDIIKHLIIINIILYIASISLQNIDLGAVLNLHYIDHPKFQFWQFFTYMFMHSKTSLLHVASNMLGLYFFGPPLYQLWGKNKFLFFYFSAGIGAAFIYMGNQYFEFESILNVLIENGLYRNEIYEMYSAAKYIPDIPISGKGAEIFSSPMLGASGAIFGLLAAYGWNFPDAELYLYFVLPVKAKYFIPVIVIADLISGITGQPLLSPVNTAYFAHVGGAIIGLIMAIIWKKNQYRMY